MGVNIIKDSKGKDHLVYSKDISKSDALLSDNIDGYEILQVLGEGGGGYVAKAKSKVNHKIYAIKQVKLPAFGQMNNQMDFIENEILILKNLNSPYITRYYKSFKQGDSMYIVIEFMNNGDLARLIKSHIIIGKPIEEERLWNIFIQALNCLDFVHSKGIIHRDIKPENLFLNNEVFVKLGDFGVAANYKNINNCGQKMNMNMQNININIQNINCKMQNMNLNFQNVNMNMQNMNMMNMNQNVNMNMQNMNMMNMNQNNNMNMQNMNMMNMNQNNNMNMQNMNMMNMNQNNNMNLNQNKNFQGGFGKINCKGTLVGTTPFMSPEMLNNINYDLKTDVYSMGCTFFQSMFWTTPRDPEKLKSGNCFNNAQVQINYNRNFYSQELINLVFKMIEINPQARPDTKTILKLFINEYRKKYSKNSFIGSVISCLFCNNALVKYFKEKAKSLPICLDNQSFCYCFLYGLNIESNITSEKWNNYLYKLRLILLKQNSIYEKDIEINPRYFLSFLLRRLHQELNTKKGNYKNPFDNLFTEQMDIKRCNSMNIAKINYSNKEESFKCFIKNFGDNYKSIVSDNFYGCMKNKIVCETCNLTTYSFNIFNFITFNLDITQKYLLKENYQNFQGNKVDLTYFFKKQNNILGKFHKICRNCSGKKIHFERKQYYTFPKYLIICLDRGSDCKNLMSISYNARLNLQEECDNPNSYSSFRLIGVVKKLVIQNKEHYISIYFDLNENGWILRDDAQRQQIDSPLEHNSGIEVMFFYEGIATNKNFNKVKEMPFNSAKNMNTMIYNPCMNNNNNNNINNNQMMKNNSNINNNNCNNNMMNNNMNYNIINNNCNNNMMNNNMNNNCNNNMINNNMMNNNMNNNIVNNNMMNNNCNNNRINKSMNNNMMTNNMNNNMMNNNMNNNMINKSMDHNMMNNNMMNNNMNNNMINKSMDNNMMNNNMINKNMNNNMNNNNNMMNNNMAMMNNIMNMNNNNNMMMNNNMNNYNTTINICMNMNNFNNN